MPAAYAMRCAVVQLSSEAEAGDSGVAIELRLLKIGFKPIFDIEINGDRLASTFTGRQHTVAWQVSGNRDPACCYNPRHGICGKPKGVEPLNTQL